MNQTITADIVIFGGGVAGLWLFNRLRQQGYHAILLDSQPLGTGQTLASQGIIHGGTKYAVNPALARLSHTIKTMPALWRACLQGQGEIDLQSVQLMSDHQHLWVPNTLLGKFVGFLTSKAMQSRVERLQAPELPEIFTQPEFNGDVYRLDEPVLDSASLMRALAKPYQDSIAQCENYHFQQNADGVIEKIIFPEKNLTITAKKYIFTAGIGNEAFSQQLKFSQIKTQRRPLRMLMLKPMPYLLHAHCVDQDFKPRLTFSSHRDENGQIIWYMGGEIAEQGATRSEHEVYQHGIAEINQLFPWINTKNLQWQTRYVDRAEPWQANGKIPPEPTLQSVNNCYFAWPIKLAYAPILAQQILQTLSDENILASQTSCTNLHQYLSQASIACQPWQVDAWN